MKITYDPAKRLKTLEERGLDFTSASTIFAGEVYEFQDERKNYGEPRTIAVGYLADRMVIVGYVQRGETYHIFSMSKANEREIKKYREQFGKN